MDGAPALKLASVARPRPTCEDRSVRAGRRLTDPVVTRPPGQGGTAARGSAPLALQHSAGNQATARLLQRYARKGYVGLKLGRNKGQEVEIKRELGTLGGYEDRLQAIAVARLAGITGPTAVGRDANGRWHAFEITNDFHGATYAPGPGAALTEVYGLPSVAGIAAQQTVVANLKAHTSAVAGQLNAARQGLYALILGVDGGEVLLNRRSFDRKAGKINVTADLATDRSGRAGAHGRESKQDEGFEPGAKSAFELNPTLFDTPARAQAVMFHEVTHLKDYELTQRLVTAYEAKHTFVGGAGVQFFEKWVRKNARPAEAQLAADIASGVQGTTEARAYVKTFIAAFDVGAGVEAAAQLVTYAKGMAGGKIPIPTQADRNPVVVELKGELAAYRKRLGRADKVAFDAAVAAAVKENPKSWLAGVKWA
jgi:hypothetical protein